MPQPQTIVSIRTYLAEHFPAFRKKNLGNVDPLLQNGVIDSMGILDVVTHIEAAFSITVADDDLVPENFGSVEAIATFVETRQSNQTA
jgi:acyl carrier protein